MTNANANILLWLVLCLLLNSALLHGARLDYSKAVSLILLMIGLGGGVWRRLV